MRLEGEPTKLTCFGAEGEGKTTFLLAALRERGISRYLWLDPYDTAPGDTRIADAPPEALPKLLGKVLAGDAFGVVVSPRGDDERETARVLAELGMGVGGVTLIVDEAHRACPVMDAPTAVLDLARRGRHLDCAVWLASQRPADVSRHLTAGGERVVFRLDEHRDLAYVRNTFGPGGEKMVRNLARGEFLYRYARSAYVGAVAWENGTPRTRLVRELSPDDFE